jgi:hypothetical protein
MQVYDPEPRQLPCFFLLYVPNLFLTISFAVLIDSTSTDSRLLMHANAANG